MPFPSGSMAAQTAAPQETQQPMAPTGLAPVPLSGSPVMAPTAQQTFGNVLKYGIPLLGVGLIDTLGQSIGVLHNDTVPNTLKAFTGAGVNGMGEFYAENQQEFRSAAEIAAFAVPGLAGMRLLKTVNGLREAGSIGAALKNSAALDVLLGNSAELTAANTRVAAATTEAAKDMGIWAGKTVNSPAVIAAKRALYGKNAVQAIRSSLAFEMGNAVAFNSSEIFYPADTTGWDQAKWVGAGLGVGVGLDAIATKFVIRGIMQTALATAKTGSTYDMSLHLGKDIEKVFTRPNDRGLGVTYYASTKADLKANARLSDQSAVYQTNTAQDIVNADAFIKKQSELMAYDTHEILPRTALVHDVSTPTGEVESQVNLIFKALDKNPMSLLPATKLAQIPKNGPTDFYEGISKQIGKIKDKMVFDALLEKDPKKSADIITTAEATLKPLEAAATEMHYVLEPDGRWNVYKNRADNWLDSRSFDSIERKTYLSPVEIAGKLDKTKNSKLLFKGDNNLVLHDTFVAEIPAGATQLDFSALYAAGSKMIKEWKPVENQVLPLTPGLNWRTLEMTASLAEQQPEAKRVIQLAGGFSSLDDVHFHVLNEKVKEFMKLMPETSRGPISALRQRMTSAISNYTPAQIIQRLNFPEPTGFTPSPVVEMIAHMRLQGMKDLNEMFPVSKNPLVQTPISQWDLVQKHLREVAGIVDETPVPTSGSLLKQGTLAGTKVAIARPLLVAAKSTPMISRADQMIAEQVRAKRDVQLERLGNIDPKTAPLVSATLAKSVDAAGELSGAALTARDVQSLHDGLVSGTGQVVYQDRINEQWPALKAMQLVVQGISKFSDAYVAMLAKDTVAPKLAHVLNPKNKGDLIDFNRIEQAYRHGWEIDRVERTNLSGPKNGYQFHLKEDSKINEQLREYHFPGGRDDANTAHWEYMPDMSVTAKKNGYSALIVSEPAGDLASAISAMSRQSGKENNALRIALGHNPITIRDFHLPTPELSKEGTFFVKNSADRVIATYTGPNFADNKRRAQSAAEQLNKTTADKAHIAIPLDLVAQEHRMNDEHFFSLIDYSDQLAKNGAGIKGGLAHTTIDTGDVTVRAMTKSLQEQFLGVALRGHAAIYEPELNYARQASASATAQGANKNLGGFNIFDRYISTAFAQSPNTNKGVFGAAYSGVETATDKFLSYAHAHFTELTNSQVAKDGAKAMRAVLRKTSSESEFEQFKANLPSYNPFEEASEWAESTFKEKNQWTSKPIAAALSRVSATLSLRFLDAGTAINNFAGLVTNTPSLMYALRRSPKETHEQWIDRTAAWGTQLADGIVTFSPMKAQNTAIRAIFKGELNGPMEEAAKMGLLEPEYASLTKALTVAQKPSMAALEKFVEIGSRMADKSEFMSRKIAWGMGYKIGKDLHGFTDERNAYIFANNFVNDMIGNYSPNNKPAMFQGMLGQPLGIFQTYMFNLFRRLYGNIERQDKASIIAQYAAQAAVFGAKSVPGYKAWNSVFQSNRDGSDDFTTRVERKFAPGVGELILNGSLSNIPKIWGGLEGDGLAFYSRGNIDIQSIPTMLDMSKAPPIQFLANTIQGVNATIKNVFSTSGFSLQQQEEVMAQFTTNRALKSIMEQASSYKLNAQGTVIDANTRDMMHVAAGILGTQTSHDRSVQEAMQRDRMIQLTQEDLRASLVDHTQAIIRSGDMSTDQFQGIVGDYLKSGGDRRYLGEWFRNNFKNATTPAVQRRLDTLAHSGKMLEFQDMLATLQQNQTPNAKKGK